MSLPLRLEPADIVPLGRRGKAEPDFAFFPRHTNPVPFYGVIELKKPSSHIVTKTRSNVAILSRDAESAIQQAQVYIRNFTLYMPAKLDASPVFLGNRAHMFVIMGMVREIGEKLALDIYSDMVARRLPPNLQLMPYDGLLTFFEARIPPRIYFLRPESGTREELINTITVYWAMVYGVATAYIDRHHETLSRSAHGARPEWLVRIWLDEKYRNIESLEEIIPGGLNADEKDLRQLASDLALAVQQARKYASDYWDSIPYLAEGDLP